MDVFLTLTTLVENWALKVLKESFPSLCANGKLKVFFFSNIVKLSIKSPCPLGLLTPAPQNIPSFRGIWKVTEFY